MLNVDLSKGIDKIVKPHGMEIMFYEPVLMTRYYYVFKLAIEELWYLFLLGKEKMEYRAEFLILNVSPSHDVEVREYDNWYLVRFTRPLLREFSIYSFIHKDEPFIYHTFAIHGYRPIRYTYSIFTHSTTIPGSLFKCVDSSVEKVKDLQFNDKYSIPAGKKIIYVPYIPSVETVFTYALNYEVHVRGSSPTIDIYFTAYPQDSWGLVKHIIAVELEKPCDIYVFTSIYYNPLIKNAVQPCVIKWPPWPPRPTLPPIKTPKPTITPIPTPSPSPTPTSSPPITKILVKLGKIKLVVKLS